MFDLKAGNYYQTIGISKTHPINKHSYREILLTLKKKTFLKLISQNQQSSIYKHYFGIALETFKAI